MIACTPRSWARVSTILTAISDQRLRDVMIAGPVGEAVAREFILIANEIAAAFQVVDMIRASQYQRVARHPPTMHGLTGLVYGLAALADQQTLAAVIYIMGEIRHLFILGPRDAVQGGFGQGGGTALRGSGSL